MAKKYNRNGSNPSGNPFSGDAEAYEVFITMHKRIIKGFPLTVADIIDYRDAAKSISAQVLYKGISGVNGTKAKNMNFDNLFKSIIDENIFDEISTFYECFNQLYHNTIPRRYKANLSKYHAKGKDSITHAIVDIEYVCENYLDVAYNKLITDYYRINIDNVRILEAIEKIHSCSNALNKICEVNTFLYKRVIPIRLPRKDYDEIKDICTIDKFYYIDKEGHCIRKNKVFYIELGEKGFSYFVKKNFHIDN